MLSPSLLPACPCLSLLVPSCPCFFSNLSWSSLCQFLGLSTEVKLGEGIWDGYLPCQAPPQGYPQERKLGRSQLLSEGPLLLLGFTQLETNLQTSPSSRFQEPPAPGLLGHRLFCHLPQGPNVYKVVHSVFYVHAECQLLGEFDARKTIIFWGER